MQVAFYSTVRQLGTSANIAAVSAGLMHYMQLPVCTESVQFLEHSKIESIFLTDCSRKRSGDKMITCSDLLVLNLTIPYGDLEHVCYRHFFVQKNIIFLIGKYHLNQMHELKQLARQYRVDPLRICTIPYNLRFEKAYKDQKVLAYLKSHEKTKKSYEDYVFEQHLRHTVHTIITYGKRKGENIYG